MDICKYCGGEIEFRYIDGICTPIHLTGGCSYSGYGSTSSSDSVSASEPYAYKGGVYVREKDDVCWPTRCPKCEADIFFIRHNGGSVWMDSLGHPWPKHGCFYEDEEPDDDIAFLTRHGNIQLIGRVDRVQMNPSSDSPNGAAILDVNCSDSKHRCLLIEGQISQLLKKLMGELVGLDLNESASRLYASHFTCPILSQIDPEKQKQPETDPTPGNDSFPMKEEGGISASISVMMEGHFYQEVQISDVAQLFSKFGEVGRIELGKRFDRGRVTCTAFITMPKVQDAHRALRALDGQVVLGEGNFALERAPRNAFANYKYKIGHKNKLFMGNLPQDTSPQDISDLILKFCLPTSIDILERFSYDFDIGFALVGIPPTYDSTMIIKALNQKPIGNIPNTHPLWNRKIRVDKAKKPHGSSHNFEEGNVAPNYSSSLWNKLENEKSVWGMKKNRY